MQGVIQRPLPSGAAEPPAKVLASPTLKGKLPTNDWWSSLAWMPFGERQYPHPLAVQCGPQGLRVYYPGANITANRDAIFGFMPAKSGDDLVLGHSAQAEFPDALVEGFSDWFVSFRFASGQNTMRVTYGHGSPFVFALYEGGQPRLTFVQPPTVWYGDEKSAFLGVTVNNKHYGLFGPSDSTWTGLGEKTLSNRSMKPYFSLAILPDNTEETLTLFKRHAHAHVTDTQVAWAYDPKSAQVTTDFTFTTKAHEGNPEGTLFALYPHQWRHSDAELVGKEYPSVRGKMKLSQGKSLFGDGNNHESSSEAMNAWYGMVLWGEATGGTKTRDLGIWLYTTEMAAINEYWFDVHGENNPPGYPAPVVTMVWGGKGANATWFSAKPEHIHGINWRPIHAGSLYLGHHPAYAQKNYAGLLLLCAL